MKKIILTLLVVCGSMVATAQTKKETTAITESRTEEVMISDTPATPPTPRNRNTRSAATGTIIAGIGTNSPTATLDVNGSLRLRAMGQPVAPQAGMIYYNSNGHFYAYDGSSWNQLD